MNRYIVEVCMERMLVDIGTIEVFAKNEESAKNKALKNWKDIVWDRTEDLGTVGEWWVARVIEVGDSA